MIEEKIREKIEKAFSPIYLELENESHAHNVPRGSETHFRLLIVSSKFNGLSRVARQRLIYEVLAEELASGVHALAQRAYSPEEWSKAAGEIEAGAIDTSSPLCHSRSIAKK